MKLSLCITTYNRPELTIQAFEKVYTDNRISEIVIIDDCSGAGNYPKLLENCESLVNRHGINKIRIAQNETNIGMSRNKHRVIEWAKNEWCILFDSDNVLDKDYIDAFYNYAIGDQPAHVFNSIMDIEKFIFCPDFAKPEFDYRQFSSKNSDLRSGIYRAHNAATEIKNDSFNCLMNTCNYIVNRNFYLQVYQYNSEHIASDTIWHNYNHLKSGGAFAVVPDMQYFHRVHKESGFMQNVNYNMQKSEEVRKKIMELCLP